MRETGFEPAQALKPQAPEACPFDHSGTPAFKAPTGTRTQNFNLTKVVLYQLSYGGFYYKENFL